MSIEWRTIRRAPNYEVSSLGEIRNVTKPDAMLRQYIHSTGYRCVYLYHGDGTRTFLRVHVLVAEAFLGKRPLSMIVRHLDGNQANNAAANLRYGTTSENQKDSVRHGTHRNVRVTHCPQGHEYNEVNTYITPRGSRTCRPCRAISKAKRRNADAMTGWDRA